MRKNKLLAILLFVPFVALLAQQNDSLKVITRSTMVGVGGTNVLDTYLSNEHFTGLGFSFLSTIERQRSGRHDGD